MIKQYASIAELREDAIRLNVFRRSGHWYDMDSTSWYGGESREQTSAYALSGNTALVSAAELMLESIEEQITTPRLAWERNVAGAYPCVPEAIAGVPTSMRRATREPNDSAPITILQSIDSSGGIPAAFMLKRGTAVLALAMALCRIRAVTLHVMCLDNGKDSEHETVITAQINTTPLDLATAAYALTSQGFARRLCYGVTCELNGATGSWPSRMHASRSRYYESLAQRLAPDPRRCLIIEAAYARDPIITDPIAWINAQIARFTSTQEENAYA